MILHEGKPEPAGGPSANRLANETSPYLRQHASNPVDWYPWGNEALERARTEDKPILLSIGYSACHWCHVMEHESFENREIAEIMNRHFVNIKVDREERPDLDSIYMNYVQMSTGSGGWPMTVFLTPSQVPFFGGTYFPSEDRYGRPGFRSLLIAVADAFQGKRGEIERAAPEILESLRQMNSRPLSAGSVDEGLMRDAGQQLQRSFDWIHGGFGSAPKFPGAMSLSFCLRLFHRTGEQEYLRFTDLTLEKMARGGIYDQLGGGFHRYSVDEKWLVPHFEKMLYDNALLSRVYLEAYQLTQKPLYRRIVEETLDYVAREMTSPEGGFYSSQDADSEGEEGKFFVWTPSEIRNVLGEETAELFCRCFGVTQNGNFEGSNILHLPRDLAEESQEMKIPVEELEQTLKVARQHLFQAREQRVKPHRDDKVLTSWNGLMLTSFAEASKVLARPDYRSIAERNANYVLEYLRRGRKLLRTCRDGHAKLPGYLEDYSHFVEGLIALFEVEGDWKWLDHAVVFQEEATAQFWDSESHCFFQTGVDNEKLIDRVRDLYDNATPAGSSVAVMNLLKLSILTGNFNYRSLAESYLRTSGHAMKNFPNGFGYLLNAADFYLGPVDEIVVAGGGNDSKALGFLRRINAGYLPNKMVIPYDPGRQRTTRTALLEGKGLIQNGPAVYICRDYACEPPITETSELEKRLKKAISVSG